MDNRDGFEKWVTGCKFFAKTNANLKKNSDGSYACYAVNDRWSAWKARDAELAALRQQLEESQANARLGAHVKKWASEQGWGGEVFTYRTTIAAFSSFRMRAIKCSSESSIPSQTPPRAALSLRSAGRGHASRRCARQSL